MIINGEGRFVLLSEPVAFPFTDVVSGTPEGPVFDLSVDLEYFNGVVYVKAEHVEEMAKTLGMITKGEADEMRATFEKQELPAHVESFINGIASSYTAYSEHSPVVPVSAPVYLLDSYEEQGKDGAGESNSSVESAEGINETSEQLSGTIPEAIGELEADGPSKPAGKVSKPSIDKGPAKLSAGSNDGFNF